MLRSVLGDRGEQESNGKLLELADREGQDFAEEQAAAKLADHEQQALEEPTPSGIDSVITQVTVQDQRPAAPQPYLYAAQQQQAAGPQPQADEQLEMRSTWKDRFRSIFCCIAPTLHEQYQRQDEAPVVIRPPPLPALPTWEEPVIGEPHPEDAGKKTLVLDLDETLVHSSFKPVPSPDYIIPVEIEGRIVDVYVLKRPFVDHFLRAVGQRFEVIVFTASLGKYADPLLDLLDKANVVRWRLFREACYPYEGSYVKDLQCLGRDLAHTIIVDNSPHSYCFQPENAIPISTFIDDMQDQDLLDCLDLLLAVEKVEDVRAHLGPLLAKKAGQNSMLNSLVGGFSARR